MAGEAARITHGIQNFGFFKWKEEGEFGEMFRKLIDGQDLFYKEK
jgi:hypothetical protein